ncbi:hypothetical protein Q7689_35010, partial [Nocardiopsis tropica]|nr:hypothetical protein [Nocardiopsis tropica]
MGDLGADPRGAHFRAVDAGGAPHVLTLVSGETARTPGFRERLERSVALSLRVSSFSLLTAVDADPWAGTPWVAFRDAGHAEPLSERIAGGDLLADRELYRFAVHTATALAVLRDAGIVHHGVTGENILVGADGAVVQGLVRARPVGPAARTAGDGATQGGQRVLGRAVGVAHDLAEASEQAGGEGGEPPGGVPGEG